MHVMSKACLARLLHFWGTSSAIYHVLRMELGRYVPSASASHTCNPWRRTGQPCLSVLTSCCCVAHVASCSMWPCSMWSPLNLSHADTGRCCLSLVPACRVQCVWCASATFRMEPEHGRSRVYAQWLDTEDKIQASIGGWGS